MIATHNPGKLREMRELLAPYGVEAVSAGELGLPEPEETGTTFARQCRASRRRPRRKARACRPSPTISGLAVDALDGAPGIYSARWAGPDKDFRLAMDKVEAMLRERGATSAEQRKRAFRLGAVRRLAGRPRRGVRGARSTARWSGRRAATQGFGYDPMFLPDGHDRTFGEMTSDEKHGLPPRGKACRTARAPSSSWRRPALQRRADRTSAFGVYVHWPFCLSKCPYCDFNSHVRHAAIDEARFVRAFAAEIAATAARVARPHGLDASSSAAARRR